MPRTVRVDAVTLLKADHRKVEKLFSAFQRARDAARQQDIVQHICTELIVHTFLEEEIFYPACAGKIDDDVTQEAYVEHDNAKVLISEIIAGEPGEEFYAAKVTVLSEDIKRHVYEEERRGGMFAQARNAGVDLDALGELMAARKSELLGEFEKNGFPVLQTRSFIGGTLSQGKPVGESASSD